MLDKLNAIANQIAELLATHPDAKKKQAAQDGSPGESEDEADVGSDSAAAKTQKSMRKSFGGQKEPQ